MPLTPLLPDAPRVVMHMRGVISEAMAGFCSRVRLALRAAGAELLLIADEPPAVMPDVPLLRLSMDAGGRTPPLGEHSWRASLLTTSARDFEPYLQRHSDWHGIAPDELDRQQGMASLQVLDHFYRAALLAAQPALLLVWNGCMARELLLVDMARQAGCPVRFLERGPFPGTLQLDADGVLGASRIAQQHDWQWPEPARQAQAHARWRAFKARLSDTNDTWWEQPKSTGPEALRRRLRIPEGKTVVLFAGQVDHDAQNVLFSPHFKNNLEAFRWFVEQLAPRDEVFILGKHHPRSRMPLDGFASAVEGRGVWLNTISLADGLALADRVAAVNSNVLLEGAMAGKPCLSLGQGIFSNKHFLYEVTDTERAPGVMKAWLEGRGFAAKRQRWEDFAAYLLAHELYAVTTETEALGLRGAGGMAVALRDAMSEPPSFDAAALGRPWPFLDEVALWHEEREVRHQGFKEVLRGCRIIAEATLGRHAPGAYARLVKWGSPIWARVNR